MPATAYSAQAYPGQYAPADGTSQPGVTHDGLICEVAFGSDPAMENPAWVDVSQYIMEFSVKRGRQKELDRTEDGTAAVMFNNSDRRFDPTHDLGPWYPNVLPMRQIRLRWVRNNIVYPLFRGFVDSWPQAWEGPTFGTSVVTATDGFRVLANVDVGEGSVWPREFGGARIGRVLDAAGWPAGLRALDAGASEIAATTIPLGSGVTALDHCREIADADLGVFFIDGQGRACFHDRNHRRGSSYLASAATFGDANTPGLPYVDIGLNTDPDRIYNDVQVSVSDGAFRSQDITSQTKFLRRTLTRSVPALARDAEGADQAAYLLSVYKDPRYRLERIRLVPTTDALFAQALGREISDHVTVKRWPQKIGNVITQECNIEALEHRATPGDTGLATTWLLSTPAYTAVDWWVLGDASYGVEGTTTKLVY